MRKYLAAAQTECIARDGPAPTEDQLSRLAVIGQVRPREATTPRQDQLEPWADQIYQWITKDRPQMTRIRELLVAWGCELSYQSLRRFVLKRNWRKRSKTTVRMVDAPPGEPVHCGIGPGRRASYPLRYRSDATCVVSTAVSARGDVRPTSWVID